MKKHPLLIWAQLLLLVIINSCQQNDQHDVSPLNQVPPAVSQKLADLGFDVRHIPPVRFEKGYRVEGDIFLTDADLARIHVAKLPGTEQYRSLNRVTGTPQTITLYIAPTFATPYIISLVAAIDRFNAENLTLTFAQVSSPADADIQIIRLSSAQEIAGVISSSGLPSSSGNPYGTILLNGILHSTYGFSGNGITTTIAHEIGHCIGLLHSDPFSGSGCNNPPGSAGVLIPGTPSSDPNSFMLSCLTGVNRPFTVSDKVALNYLY